MRMKTRAAWPAFLFVLLVEKKDSPRCIRSGVPPHLNIKRTETPEGNEMTKLLSAAAAFVLFAPIATAILMQAAQIVA